MIVKKSDDAVSPVIGVMLMIVIVVIIAAVVTAFATGMMSETEAAPVAALDVEILSSVEALEGMNGPELFITHLSGDPIDTKDIELRFSWTHDGCSHYSTYSADGFKEEVESYNARSQALYVKSTMSHERTEYGSGALDHYFGDVILTPGLKLTATSEFLPGKNNVGSPYMDFVFDNYKTTSSPKEQITVKTYEPEPHPDNCGTCARGYSCPTKDDPTLCYYCEGAMHKLEDCGPEQDYCGCSSNSSAPANYEGGIMTHLPEGTAVDVMIIHTPSNKAIYDKTVVVQ